MNLDLLQKAGNQLEGSRKNLVKNMKRRIVQVVWGVQIFQIAQQADDSSTKEYDEFCKISFYRGQVKSSPVFDNRMITDDPGEAKAAGEALGVVTKDAEKKMMDEREEVERENTEAKAAEKGEAEEDEDPDGIDEEEEEEKANHRGRARVPSGPSPTPTGCARAPTGPSPTLPPDPLERNVGPHHRNLAECHRHV